MLSLWKSKGEKLHTRNIEVTTYEYDSQRIITEGFLKDDRFQASYAITGEERPSGVVHDMSIRLLVNCSNLLIEDIDVDLISVPREACWETKECLAPIKGLTITRGFTSKVKKICGGSKGCTHLVELLVAMAPAVFLGRNVSRSLKPSGFNADHAKTLIKYLVNTCHAWREDNPFIERYKKILTMK